MVQKEKIRDTPIRLPSIVKLTRFTEESGGNNLRLIGTVLGSEATGPMAQGPVLDVSLTPYILYCGIPLGRLSCVFKVMEMAWNPGALPSDLGPNNWIQLLN